MKKTRETPVEITKDEFKTLGYKLVDTLSAFLDTIRDQPVTPGESPGKLQNILATTAFPETAAKPDEILAKASDLLLHHSLLNGHPKFMGYITSSPAPLAALADLLAATVNPNVGAQILSPMATEIEKQTIGWLAEFIGVSPHYGGILVSGGNLANFTGFLAGRTAKLPVNAKTEGLTGLSGKPVIYCSSATHIWVEKAAVLFGLGSSAIRWIKTDASHKMDNDVLEKTIREDLQNGCKPIMVIGTAGDVSTGVVDELRGIASICSKYDLWFHVDGAYGLPAAIIPEYKPMFNGIEEADSIALDPHKWLYSPLEAGCTLVKNPRHLTDTFSAHPEYYNFNAGEEAHLNFYEYGLQNSRGFRALKVWMILQQAGRNGYVKMIREDIELSRLFFELADAHPELEAITQNLSITTLRYIPTELRNQTGEMESYLNRLNESLLNTLQNGGEVFLSNAIVDGRYCLRGCIVNFRTSSTDIEEIIEIIVRVGRQIHEQLMAESMKPPVAGNQ